MERESTAERPSTTVTCSDCGKEARVPFAPTPGRPVYCAACFPKHREASRGPPRSGGPGRGGFGRRGATQAKPRTYTRSDYPGYNGPPE